MTSISCRFRFDAAITAGLKFDRLALSKGWDSVWPPRLRAANGHGPRIYRRHDRDRFELRAAEASASGGERVADVPSFIRREPALLRADGVLASVAQQIFQTVRRAGKDRAARLAYRTREGVTVAVPDRVDHTTTCGTSASGIRMGPDLRLAFNIDQNARESAVDGRSYHGLKYGTAVTYGF